MDSRDRFAELGQHPFPLSEIVTGVWDSKRFGALPCERTLRLQDTGPLQITRRTRRHGGYGDYCCRGGAIRCAIAHARRSHALGFPRP